MNPSTLDMPPRHSARRLQGKVAIVTGAGSSGPGFGTGKAAALAFAREGAMLVLVDQIAERAEETRALIAAEGGDALVCQADVSAIGDCERVVRQALERFGRIDVLDNNVGIVVRGTVVDVTEAAWDRIMAVNVKGIVLMSKFAVPAMARTGGGSIINVSSISPRRPYAATPYSVSKGAVDALTQAMAIDHGPQGIRVNAIAPGPLNTPRAEARQTPEQREMRRKTSPLGIEGGGWDVAWAAVYLASDEARYVTGTIVTVDGGVSIQGHRYR